MGFRFRRSIKLLPGVRLNFSTGGVSTSLGGRGATVNIGRRGARATVGLPGTGLSYSTGLFGRSRAQSAAAPASVSSAGSSLPGWLALGILLLAIAMCAAGGDSPPAEPPVASQAPTAQELATRIVAGQGVNCRASPGTGGAILAKLDKGATVPVLARQAGWSRIAQTGGECWVSDALLTAP